MSTRYCAIIGAPIAHSLSPAMHGAAYAALGLDYEYLALHVDPDRLGIAIAGARALGFRGLNVTAPHKEASLAHCRPDELARAVGAVNTIVLDGDEAHGTNTDVYGLEQAIGIEHKRAVILGAGGAARAVAYVLDRRGVEVAIHSRREGSLIVAGRTHRVHSLASIDLREIDLLVDATPAGLGDQMVQIPIDALRASTFVLDLCTRASTALSRAARERGARVQLGDVMLLHQGARAFSLFTGEPAPVDVMRRALDRALGRPQLEPRTELQ